MTVDPAQLGASASLPQIKEDPQLLSGSGSFQSYLSSAGSYHRHAKGTTVPTLVHVGTLSPRLQTQVVEDSLAVPLSQAGVERLRYGHLLGGLHFFWSLYCCVSVLFFSFNLHSALRGAVAAGHPQPNHVSTYRVSPLTNISVRQRMSVTFPRIPLSGHLETFTLTAHSLVNTDLTACLWVEEERLDTLATLSTWPGPLSLVIVTSAPSGSADYLVTLKRLQGLIGLRDMHGSSGLSLHIIRVFSSSGGSANAYLNLARLLAPTNRVVLFPDGLPSHLSNNLYSSIVLSTSPLPLVLGNDDHGAYPFPPMSPVVLPKDYPTWCTERFSLFQSRSLDWEDCLWQLWLESSGKVKSAMVDGWPGGEAGISNVSDDSDKIVRRWTIKYRAEACALAMKKAQVLQTASDADKKAFQWREFCPEVGLAPKLWSGIAERSKFLGTNVI